MKTIKTIGSIILVFALGMAFHFSCIADELIVTESGNVGIGTATPMRQLHLSSSTSWDEMIMEVANGAANLKKWNFLVDGGAGNPRNFSIRRLNDAGSGGPIDFFIQGATGNIGIGTTSPRVTVDVPNNLDVQGGRRWSPSFRQSETPVKLYVD